MSKLGHGRQSIKCKRMLANWHENARRSVLEGDEFNRVKIPPPYGQKQFVIGILLIQEFICAGPYAV